MKKKKLAGETTQHVSGKRYKHKEGKRNMGDAFKKANNRRVRLSRRQEYSKGKGRSNVWKHHFARAPLPPRVRSEKHFVLRSTTKRAILLERFFNRRASHVPPQWQARGRRKAALVAASDSSLGDGAPVPAPREDSPGQQPLTSTI